MTIGFSSFTRLLLLTSMLALVPFHISSNGPAYDQTLANNADRGKGQGAAHAGSHGGGPGANGASADARGSASSTGVLSASLGRFNSLHALSHASPNSPMAKFAAEYQTAFGGFATDDVADDATIEGLASILVKYGNKELTPEAINWINQRVIEPTLLEQANAALAPVDPSADPTATAPPTLADRLAEQVRIAQESETNQGLHLGPIY
jgi:hypothetical protein